MVAIDKFGAVVQLVRIPACHAGGRGFESLPHRSKRVTQKVILYFFVRIEEAWTCRQASVYGSEYALHLSGRDFGLPGVLPEGPSGNRHRLTAIFF